MTHTDPEGCTIKVNIARLSCTQQDLKLQPDMSIMLVAINFLCELRFLASGSEMGLLNVSFDSFS